MIWFAARLLEISLREDVLNYDTYEASSNYTLIPLNYSHDDIKDIFGKFNIPPERIVINRSAPRQYLNATSGYYFFALPEIKLLFYKETLFPEDIAYMRYLYQTSVCIQYLIFHLLLIPCSFSSRRSSASVIALIQFEFDNTKKKCRARKVSSAFRAKS